MSSPDFSIIIPSYNQGCFLGECITSIVRSANFANVLCQIIVVDNCSTDSTADVLIEHHNAIDKCIVEKDSGQSNAINKGFAYVKGRFVNWLCCDDRLTLEAFANISGVFNSNSGSEVVCGRANYFKSGVLSACSRTSMFSSRLDIFMAFVRIVQPSTFWRTDVFELLIPLNEDLKYVMDLDLWLRYLTTSTAARVVFIEYVLSEIILHADCKSIKKIHEFSSEIEGVKHNVIDTTTSDDGSFLAYGINSASAINLKKSIAKIIRTSELVSRAKSFKLRSVPEIVNLALHIPSILKHLAVVRPEVLRLYS